jgi:hypothetical protein
MLPAPAREINGRGGATATPRVEKRRNFLSDVSALQTNIGDSRAFPKGSALADRAHGPNDRKARIVHFQRLKTHSNFIGNSPFQMAVS